MLTLIHRPWFFALTILAVNTFKLSLSMIVLPSMIVPFAGIALYAYWTFTTGLTFVPSSANGWVALIPHTLTIAIGFQAYSLLTPGAFLFGKSWLRPHSGGAQNRRQGYVSGLQQLAWLSVPAFGILLVGAIYEAFSLIYVVHALI